MEVKSIDHVPKDGMVPPRGTHPFLKIQVRELKNITQNGGVGIGIIICGKYLNYVFPNEINELGQAKWIMPRALKKEKGQWNIRELLTQLSLKQRTVEPDPLE